LFGFDEPVEAQRVFQALAVNGTVTMPMRETFWAARYSILTDQFGVPWETTALTRQNRFDNPARSLKNG
jgi:uncharacterized glyoxalase superfamily protein PhnB